MKKEELRAAIQEMDTYQFGLKNELHNKLTKVTSYVAKQEVLDMVSQLDKQIEEVKPTLPVIPQFVADWLKKCEGYKHNLFGVYEFAPEVVSVWIFENESKKERVDLIARAWLDDYTIEPEQIKTRQVLVKFFDNEEYKTELTEESAKELIEFLEANKK